MGSDSCVHPAHGNDGQCPDYPHAGQPGHHRKGQVRRHPRSLRRSAPGHHGNPTNKIRDEGRRGCAKRSGVRCDAVLRDCDFARKMITGDRLIGRTAVLALLYPVFMCAAPTVTQAQFAGGNITGIARGDSDSPMPGLQVSMKDVTTGQVRTALTDTSGSYSLPALPVGNYELTVSARGFVTQVLTGITVAVGSGRALDIRMRPGRSQTAVRANVSGVPANQSSGNVDSSVVENTPLNGRDWTQLATLQAGVTGVQTGSSSGGGNTERGFGAPVSISGARPDQNSYRLDGISINDYSNGAPGSVLGDNLGIDAVEQVSVLGSNYPAEYGRTSGGVINAVTRSGKNAIHGTVYEFLRNSALDARNFFDGRVIPSFRRNQFGGSAGNTLRKEPTFIFGDYEGLRQSLGVTTVNTVP